MTSSPNEREMRMRLLHLEEFEELIRGELFQAEELAFNSTAAQAFRHRRKTERRELQRQVKEDDDVLRSARILERRVKGLEHDEQRARSIVQHQASLHLDAILRVLERDIQTDVDQIQYDGQQRRKYFNKTVAVIFKNESNERRDFVNSERYERLVLIHKYDNALLELQISEKLRVFREQQRKKIERFQHTSSSAEYRRNARQLAALRKSKGIADGKKKKYTQVLPRTDASHSMEYLSRVLEGLEDRETGIRGDFEDEEENERNGIARAFAHVGERTAEKERTDVSTQQDGALRAALRHVRAIEKSEFTARNVVATDERAAFLAIERRFTRETVAEARRLNADVTRQVTHQRKMDDRHTRMAFARTHFVERQILMANTMRDTPIEQEIFPAFTPRPPEMIAVHHQLQRMAAASATAPPPSSASSSASSPRGGGRQRQPALEDELGTVSNLAIARQNVIVRSLMAQHTAGRVAIEKDERRERFQLVSDLQSASGEPRDKAAAAAERRRTEQQARESSVAERIDRDGQRSMRARQRVEDERKLVKDLDKLQKDEASRRQSIRGKRDQWWSRFLEYADAIAGKRIITAFEHVTTTEASSRKDLAAAEARLRQTIRTSMLHHKPQSRIVHVEPLPPPKTKWDIAGASPRPERASTKQQSSSSSTRGGSKTARASTTASGSTKRSTAAAKTSRRQSSHADDAEQASSHTPTPPPPRSNGTRTPSGSDAAASSRPASSTAASNAGAPDEEAAAKRSDTPTAAADEDKPDDRTGPTTAEEVEKTAPQQAATDDADDEVARSSSSRSANESPTAAAPPPASAEPRDSGKAADDANDAREDSREKSSSVPPTPLSSSESSRAATPKQADDDEKKDASPASDGADAEADYSADFDE